MNTQKKKYRSLITWHEMTWGKIRQEAPGKWRARWKDSEGVWRRVRIQAETLDQANALATIAVESPPEARKKFFDSNACSINRSPKILICDAMLRATESRHWNDSTRKKVSHNIEYFLRWIDSLNLNYWHELRFEHVDQYVKSLLDRGRKRETINRYLAPVKITSKWMAANWPRYYHDICVGLRRLEDDHTPAKILDVVSILDFLDWLLREKENFDHLRRCDYQKMQNSFARIAPVVVLQGLASLSIQEALRLSWKDVCFEQECISVRGEIKNRYRERTIPVAKVVIWILSNHHKKHGNNPNALVFPFWSEYSHYSNILKKALQRWGVEMPPKNLRKTLRTTAEKNGWHSYYFDRYFGHSPSTTGQRYYVEDPDLEVYRTHVLNHIEKEIAVWKAPQDTLILT